MLKKYLLCVALLLLAPLTQAAEVLRIGMSPNYPPLTYQQDGRIVGIEADNAVAVGRILARPVEMIPLPFNELLPALEEGRIDIIMSGMSVTPQRSARVLFTDPYLEVGQMAIMLKSKVARFAQPWAIYQDVRIGVEPGTTGAAFAEKELPDARISYFDNPDAAFAGLRKEQIDLYLHDAPTSWRLASSDDNDDLISQYKALTSEQLAWAVRQGDARLAGELNSALRQLRANGTLKYIINRWIPVQIEVR